MSQSSLSEKLAIEGGPKAVAQFEGQPRPRHGIDEFLSIAERFGFSEAARARMREVISEDDLTPELTLAHYGSGLPQTKVDTFEEQARKIFGIEYALGVTSGTAALHSAFVAAGVGPGTEVICPAIGFFATASEVVMAKGIPVFCDVDQSLSMDPAKIEALITPRTVAIAPTHVWGTVCDMDPIMAIARKHNLKVIEDCAQSPGARYKGRYVGTIGDLGCFSISCYKIIGAGEGGLVLTHDQRLWERAAGLAEAGGLWRPKRFAPPRYPGELFPGTNYRLSELEAAVDIYQLAKLPGVVNRFHTAKMQILQELKTFKEITPRKMYDVAGEIGYTICFFPETFELGHKIVSALNAEGIQCHMRGAEAGPDWHQYSHMFAITQKTGPTPDNCPFECPLYLARGGHAEYARGDCPVADDLYDRAIWIWLRNQWLTANDCHNIAHGINKVLSAYCTEDAQATRWI